ncbi:LysR family transcriptional regulator [Actinomadura fulvescens]|uniref:LysR family transcriptional regulator n=1 Tax=Actinomadura fulvescens TaxID=46160 RepID=A0ABN3PPD3_9ACTN
MELRVVEAFLAVADELHFGRAAVRLGVTQGRVSQMIRSLEREIGAALFVRTSRKVRLTLLGERFRAGALAGYEQLMGTLRECQEAATSVGGLLRIGYLPGAGAYIAPMVAAFQARYADCRVEASSIPLPAALIPYDALASGEWDIVVAWAPSGDPRVVAAAGLTVGSTFISTPRAVVVPQGHPLTALETVSWDDLANYELLNPSNTVRPELRDLWTPRSAPSGRVLRYTADDVMTMGGGRERTVEDLMLLVALGRGLYVSITTLLEHFPYQGLDLVPMRDAGAKHLAPMWTTAAETAAIRAFAELTAEHRRDHAPRFTPSGTSLGTCPGINEASVHRLSNSREPFP